MSKGRYVPGLAAWFFCVVFFSLATLSASAGEPDLSQMSTEALLSRALEISRQLESRLTQRLTDSETLRKETGILREDLRKAQEELASLRAELEKRSSDSTASANEVSEARTALAEISRLIGSSSTSWKSSVEDVDKALKAAARELSRTKALAWGAGAIALAASAWAVVETIRNGALR